MPAIATGKEEALLLFQHLRNTEVTLSAKSSSTTGTLVVLAPGGDTGRQMGLRASLLLGSRAR